MDHVRRIVIGLGSNLGDRASSIAAAIARLRREPDLRVMRQSPVYESAAVGGPPQPDYLNSAVLVVSALEVRELLGRLLAIEEELGRSRSGAVRWGPRTIDLDVLWVEGEVVEEPGLMVPHPRLHERPFALRPLVDLAPDASDPRSGERFATAAAASHPLKRLDA